MAEGEGQTLIEMKMRIGGQWVDAADGSTMEVLDPARGTVIAVVPKGGEADVDRAVAAAREGLERWMAVNPEDRAKIMWRIAEKIHEHADHLAELESKQTGSPGQQWT